MAIIHRIVCVERSSHLLRLNSFLGELGIFDKQLFNHLRLQFNVQIHAILRRVNDVKARLHLLGGAQ